MTDRQAEALRLAERISDILCASEEDAKAIAAAADELVRPYSENEAFQAGYAAARLEIASLQARIKTMAEEHADELMVAHLDGRMRGRSTEPAGEYPELPDAAGVVVEHVPVGGGWVRHYQGDSYTADQMRAYVDADRAMRAAQPAGAQQPGAGTWTPLPGTLPEPGKPVLLDIGKEYPIRAMWAAKFTLLVGMEDDSGFGDHDELTDEWYCPEGWYEWNEHEECHWRVDETPVSWCELPPKEQK